MWMCVWVSEYRKICIWVCVCMQADPGVIFCNTPSFISGLVWVQVVGFNVVQMGDTERRVARFFQSFGRTRALLIKAEEIFTVPQTKPCILILEGERRASETAMLYFVFIKGGDWQLGENFPALNQGSYWRGQSREHRDLAKQSNALASCWKLGFFSDSLFHAISFCLSFWAEDCYSLDVLLLAATPKPAVKFCWPIIYVCGKKNLFAFFFFFWLVLFWFLFLIFQLITVSRVLWVLVWGELYVVTVGSVHACLKLIKPKVPPDSHSL